MKVDTAMPSTGSAVFSRDLLHEIDTEAPTVTAPGKSVTELLVLWRDGDKAAQERLMALVYDDLRRRAAGYLRRERGSHTLQPTALVHEAYLRLVDQDRVVWQNRAHFLAVAASMMRRVLVDHGRRQKAEKRGGLGSRVTLDEAIAPSGPRDLDLLALDAALSELAVLDDQQARIVEMRAFGGLSVEETAEAIGISSATVKRHWAFALAWLQSRLRGGGPSTQ
jgi:RNA polymerase sigma factor (TIGR02999 family)